MLASHMGANLLKTLFCYFGIYIGMTMMQPITNYLTRLMESGGLVGYTTNKLGE